MNIKRTPPVSYGFKAGHYVLIALAVVAMALDVGAL